MSTTISQAEQKRIKEATNYLDFNLRRKLTSFENKYLQHSVEWAIKDIENKINLNQQAIEKVDKTKAFWQNRIDSYNHSIEKLKQQLALDSILKLNVLSEAKVNYDEKVNKIVALLVQEGFNHLFLKIEEISARGSELEFLISNDKKEIHARVIFACGEIKAPHFRFITTVRHK